MKWLHNPIFQAIQWPRSNLIKRATQERHNQALKTRKKNRISAQWRHLMVRGKQTLSVGIDLPASPTVNGLHLLVSGTKWSKINERGGATCLDERVDVQHEGLRPADDKLINAGDGVRPATQQTLHRSYASSTFNSHAAHSECGPLSCLPACFPYRSEKDSSSVDRDMCAFGGLHRGHTTPGPRATLWPRCQIIQTSDVTETNPADWCRTAGANSRAMQKAGCSFQSATWT